MCILGSRRSHGTPEATCRMGGEWRRQMPTSYAYDTGGEQARQRLGSLEAWLDPGTTRLLGSLGVGPGWRCLEVGGGGGSVAAWLSERVRPDGYVLATDIDPRFLVTLNLLEARKHDILYDELPEGAFDLVHARAGLEHLPARQAALRRLVTTLTPGGWLLVEDGDFVSFVPGSGEDDAYDAIPQVLGGNSGSARSAAADYGRQLYGAFLAQGLVGRVAVAQGESALA